eukprot:TRINITY_DN2386_c1_g1_i1.p1 TRINITY_DN2386_c1_g1~~TRINITY_DN2386_c1_g1_i1.p1  ORF type:complete len:885 (-),score=225.91 TRINITY_DN2386_c1_g1_i1:428-3082(-)
MGNTGSTSSLTTTAPPLCSHYIAKKNIVSVITSHAIEDYDLSSPTKRSASLSFKNVRSALFFEEEDLVITGDDEGKLREYEASTGKALRTINAELVTTPEEDIRDGHVPQKPNKTIPPVLSLALLDDDSILVGGSDGTLRLFARSSGNQLWMIHAASLPNGVTPRPASDSQKLESQGSGTFKPNSINAICVDGDIIYVGDDAGLIGIVSSKQTSVLDRLEGHFGSIHSIVSIRSDSANCLVSAASDQTIRIWNVDSKKELCGYKFHAESLLYEPLRNLLFLGTHDSGFAIAKVTSTSSSAELRIIRKFSSENSAVVSLSFCSESDMMLASTNLNTVRIFRNVTGITHAKALETRTLNAEKSPKQNFQENVESKSGLSVQDLGTDWSQELLSRDQPENFDVQHDFNLIKKCSELTEFDQESKRQLEIERQFSSLTESFRKNIQELHRDVLHRYNQIRLRIPAAFDADKERAQLEFNLKIQLEEMKARHARELAQLEQEQNQTRNHFEDEIPILKKRAVTSLSHLKQELAQSHSQMSQKVSEKFRKLILDTFPIINNQYQIGGIIRPGAISVFNGLDVNTMEVVAIKAFPVGVNLELNFKHEVLVPLLDVIPTQNTIFVVMKKMQQNLQSWVQKCPNQQPEDCEVAEIIFTLLKGLAFLHSNRMVVRDLTPEHILMNEEARPRLSHLGVMRSLQGIDSEIPEQGRIYAAPELFGRVVKGSSDLWSLGCVLLYLLQTPKERRIPLFYGNSDIEILTSMVQVVGKPSAAELGMMAEDCKMAEDGLALLHQIQHLHSEESTIISPLHEQCSLASPEAKDLLSKLIVFIPHRRLSAIEALHHPYFQSYGLIPSALESDLHPHTDLTSTFSDTSDNDMSFQDIDELSYRDK